MSSKATNIVLLGVASGLIVWAIVKGTQITSFLKDFSYKIKSIKVMKAATSLTTLGLEIKMELHNPTMLQMSIDDFFMKAEIIHQNTSISTFTIKQALKIEKHSSVMVTIPVRISNLALLNKTLSLLLKKEAPKRELRIRGYITANKADIPVDTIYPIAI